MPEKMSISVNGDSRVPPGFRFHPTEEELLQYYLRKKVGGEPIDLDVICEVDLNKLEPWDIQERCKIGSTPQNDWYFFSHKDKKYPTGTRANRATTAGFWKATGRDKMIYSTSTRLRIGMRKTLVFYMGRAPHGQKSDWIIHEYRLVDDNSNNARRDNNEMIDVQVHKASDAEIEERWVVCRIFKKNYHKAALDSPNIKNITSTDSADNNLESSTQPNNYNTLDRYYSTSPAPSDHDEGALEHIFRDFTRTLKGTEIHDQSKDAAAMNIIRLPYLVENPNSACSTELACHDHYLRHGQYGLQLPPPTNCDVLAFGSEKQQLISSFSTRELIGYDGDVNRLDVSATNTAAPAETTNKITDSSAGPIKNWAAFDRLVASHLNMSFSQPPDHDHDDGPYSHHDLHHIFRSSSTSDISSSSRVDFDGPSSDPDYGKNVFFSVSRGLLSTPVSSHCATYQTFLDG